MQPFKILTTKTLINEPYCHIVQETVELPNKGLSQWYCHLTPDAVIVVVETKKGEYLLQRNYKHGSREIITEFCAGMIDTGESPLDAAKRELLEETGYTAEKWTYLGQCFASPTSTTMKHHYFLAQEAQQTHDQNLEAEEQIETFTVPNRKDLVSTFLENNSSTASFAALEFLNN